SSINLASGSNTDGFEPCVGLGADIEGVASGALVDGNTIAISDDFTLALGTISQVTVDAQGTPLAGTAATTVTHNLIAIGSAEVAPWCVFLSQHSGKTVSAGAAGIALLGEQGTIVRGNTLTVGSNATSSAGLDVVGGDAHVITHNHATVGDALSGVTS